MTRAFISMVSITVIALAFGWINEWTVVFVVLPVFLVAVLFAGVGFLFSSTAPHVNFRDAGVHSSRYADVHVQRHLLSLRSVAVVGADDLELHTLGTRGQPEQGICHEYDGRFDYVWDLLFLVGMIAIVLPLSYVLLRRKLIS